jgi:hypothetical protein
MTNYDQHYRIRFTEIIVNATLTLVGMVLAAAMIVWLGINLILGCGEVTRTIDGTYIKGECVLVPWVDPNTYDHFIE